MLTLALALAGCPGQPAAADPPTPTPLVSHAGSCQTAGTPAHRAGVCEREASVRIASYPFAGEHGPRGLALLAEAAACHAAAGNSRAAERVAALRKRVARRLDDDYRVLRLRLALSLAQARKTDASQEVEALLSLLAGAPHDAYTTWLRRLARELP